MELIMPLLRADFELNYMIPRIEHPPLSCPITAFGGTEDDEVPVADLEAWGRLTTGPFRLRMFASGHFFLHEHKASLTAAAAEALLR